MDDMKISLSVPATIYSFGETQNLTKNQYVTHAKLKVFYVGQTPDKRVFTKQFSDQLLQTLPGTPVVAYYDEEKDDFVGHNHTQYVFGYVPETATISYVQENGATFALTDVLLFTGRNDNIGAVANKVIGHSHSLELDPSTVEYQLIRSNNTLESITFTKGHFIGLSVLGENEQPAFTGSAFFANDDTELKAFVDSFQEFKREVEFYKSGGKEMNDETNLPILENDAPIITEEVITEAKEIADVETEVSKEGEDIAPETPVELSEKPMEPKMAEMPMDPEEDPEEEIPTEPTNPIEEPEEEEDMVKKDEVIKSEVIPALVVEAQTLKGMEDVREQKTKEESVGENANAAALNQAERQELNEYRKKAKLELIDSYGDLSSELKEKYRKTHDQFTVEQMDRELAFELVKSQRQIKNVGIRVFAAMPNEVKQDTLADVINRYKDK